MSDIPDREKYLEHSDIGKLMTQLWCKDRSVDIDHTQSLHAFQRDGHGYADIVENLYTEDVASFSALLERALHYRVGSSITENGEFRTAIAFHLIPIEFHYIARIRNKKNLPTVLPSSDLFSSDAKRLPPPYPGLSIETDPVLYAAIEKAIEQEWLDRKAVEEMM